jgi:hypothetical protein
VAPDWSHMSARRFRGFVLAVVALFVVLRLWNMQGLTYYQDDWPTAYGALDADLGWLFEPYNGYFAPLSRSLAWAVVHLSPFNYTVAAVAVTVLWTAAATAALLVIREYVGAGRLALFLFGLFLLTPLAIVANAWWTVGISVAPTVGLCSLAWFAQIRWQRSREPRMLVIGSAAAVLALLATPKTALFLLFLLAWAVCLNERNASGLRDRVRALGTWGWLLFGLLAVYVTLYVLLVGSNLRSSTGDLPQSVVAFLQLSGLSVFLPSGVGGPWSYDQAPFPRVVELAPFAVILLIVVYLALVRTIFWGFRIKHALLVLPLVALISSNAVLVAARGVIDARGYQLFQQGRFWLDVLLPTLVTFGVLWRLVDSRRTDSVSRRRLVDSNRPAFLEVVAGVVVVSVLIAWGNSTEIMRKQSGAQFLANAQRSLNEKPAVSLSDRAMPKELLNPVIFQDYGQVSEGLRYWVERQTFDEPTSEYFVFNDQGRIVPGEIEGGVRSLPGPVSNCGYLVGQFPTAIRMESQLFDWKWVVRINYLVGSATRLLVSAPNGEAQSVEVPKGLGRVYLTYVGPVTEFFVRTETSGQSVCVDSIDVGEIVPRRE